MSVYYNKKLISGVRDVPQMTLAEYNALTNKPDLWVRTDAPESDRGISASDIEYSTGVSVKDKIDDVTNLDSKTFTSVNQNVSIGSMNSIRKVNGMAHISLVLIMGANISANSDLVSCPMTFANGLVEAIVDNGNAIVLNTQGNKLNTSFALSSGTVLRIGATVYVE